MDNNFTNQFEITDDLLASNKVRLFNLVIDYGVRLGLLFSIGIVTAIIGLLCGVPDLADRFENINKLEEVAITILVMLLYYNVFEMFFGATIGKFITKTIVVDENGERPDKRAILMRSICRIIPFDPLSYFGTPCRGWHDSLSKTYVVNKADFMKAKELHKSFEEIGNPNV